MKWKEQGIKRKVFGSFFLILFLSFIVLFILVYTVASNYSNKISNQYLQQSQLVTQAQIDTYYKDFSRLTMSYYHLGIIEKLEALMEATAKGDASTEEEELEKHLTSIANADQSIRGVFLQTEQGIYHSGKNYPQIEEYFASSQNTVHAAKGRMVWLPTEEFATYVGKKESSFVAARTLNNEKQQPLGILWLTVNPSLFRGEFNAVRPLEGAESYLLSQEGNIILSTGGRPSKSVEEYIENLPFGENFRQRSEIIKLNNRNTLAVYTNSYNTNWIYLSLVSQRAVMQDFRVLPWFFALFSFFFVVLLVLLLASINRSVLHPIDALIGGINEVSHGNMEVHIAEDYPAEMGRLVSHFNHMVQQVDELIRQVREQEKAKSDLQVQAIAMQMSPHFIYNSLNTVKWIAAINRQDNIVRLVESLTHIFKNISKKDDKNNTIADEILFLESYCTIQKARFSNFTITFHVQDGADTLRIKKFLLQPMVENAILHGIHNQLSGEIAVTIWTEDMLRVTISDNGKGFSLEQFAKENRKDVSYASTGIHNVKQMIALSYGEPYGLTIESQPGKGTRIDYYLPLLEEGEE